MHDNPFQSYIEQYAAQAERVAADKMEVLDVYFEKEHVRGSIQEGRTYITSINFTSTKVTNAVCTCFYEKLGPCRHIIATLRHVETILNDPDEEENEKSSLKLVKDKKSFTLEDVNILELDERELKPIAIPIPIQTNYDARLDLRKASIDPNTITAKINKGFKEDWIVRIFQGERHLELQCSCFNPSKKICEHIYFVLLQIGREYELQLAFNKEKRQACLAEHAKEIGLHEVENWDDLFSLTYDYNRLHIQAKYTMLSLSDVEKEQLKKQLLPTFSLPKSTDFGKLEFLLVDQSPYNQQLEFTLYQASLTKGGEIKSPFDKVDLNEKMRGERNPDNLVFYASLIQQDSYEEQFYLYADIVKNPIDFPVYYHDNAKDSKRISAKNLILIDLKIAAVETQIAVKQSGDFFVMTCDVKVENKWYSSRNINLLGAFFLNENKLFFIQKEAVLQVIRFFKSKNHEVFIHNSQFDTFRTEFLEPLENNVKVEYSFVKKAPAKLVKQKALNRLSEFLIYLSESDDFILITPVVMYGDTEVNVLSKRTVLTENPDGTLFSVDRLVDKELQFLQDIQKEHCNFQQETQQPFFYLHKKEFLDGGWFLDVFDHWREKGYSILGFNQIKNNRLNANKMKVNMQVKSGIDWFDTEIKINFGKQTVELKDIQKAIINRSRFVQLGDGTQGVLPESWMQKFALQFRHAELQNDLLRVHKSNFHIIDDLFEAELLSNDIKKEVKSYKAKLNSFQKIEKVKVPSSLKGELRDYQKEGLNWLNFLDDFGFGGVLADDMGLGKTIQIISYILLQIEKGRTEPNLVILPTSLLFNWQRELEKFAPSLKFIVLHGNNRNTNAVDFNAVNVVITTYGTMLSDIEILRKTRFNLVILDESQAIKSPSSKRYKAARLLNGRQHLAMTGTPIENNTFDLYAQLSFAIPGLLGSAKRFSDEFAVPIDKFQDSGRAKELQNKIHPFVLRRTKAQVAKELPEKTEMVLYCEMDTEQQRVYDLYKVEFQKYLAGLSADELHSSSLHVLQGLTKLRQICNSPALLSDEAFYGEQSAKMDELMAQIENLKDEHKLVIFSQFVGMLDLIKQRLVEQNLSFAYLTGQTKNREEQVDLFQNDPSVRIFLVSLKAGGTGLNLTEADYVFLVDPWWNPAVENQAIDRAHRIGQTKKVMAIRLITPNTIEEKIMELQKRKRELSNDLIHTDTNVLKQLSKDDLLTLID